MRPSAKRPTLLGVSLLSNVFLGCILIGGLYEWHHSRLGQPTPPSKGLHVAIEQLPEQRSQELRELLRDTRRENRSLILAGRQARQEVINQLLSPQLNRDALDKGLADARQADIELRARVDTALAGFATKLEPDERLELATAMHLGKVPIQAKVSN